MFKVLLRISLALLVLVKAINAEEKALIVLFGNSTETNDQILARLYAKSVYEGCLNYMNGDNTKCTILQTLQVSYRRLEPVFKADDTITHFILGGRFFLGAANKLPEMFPTKTFLLLDTIPNVESSNLQVGLFADDQIGFLAGAVAGLATKTESVIVIAGFPTPSTKRIVNGFKEGVVSVCPKCEIIREFSESETNFNGAAEKLQALQTANKPFDVMFAALRAGNDPVIQWGVDNGIKVIGSDTDKEYLFTGNAAQFYMRSVIKHYGEAVKKSFENKAAGITGGEFYLSLNDTGISVTTCPLANCDVFFEFITQVTPAESPDECPKTSLVTKEVYLGNIEKGLLDGTWSTKVEFETGDLANLLVKENDTFTELTPFGTRPPPTWRHSFNLATNNTMLLFGGQDDSGFEQNTLYSLDFDFYQWKKVVPAGNAIPPPRESHASAFFDNGLYIYGGMSGHITYCDLWKYSIIDNTWTEIPITGPATGENGFICRGRAGYTNVGSELWIFGGFDETYSMTNTLIKINLIDGKSTIDDAASNSITLPPTLDSMVVAGPNSTLYMYGGNNVTAYFETLYSFNIETSTWELPETREDPPGALATGAMVMIDSRRIMFIGGINQNGLQARTFIYNIVKKMWIYTESKALEFPLGFHTAFYYQQGEDSCTWNNGFKDYPLCQVDTRPSLVTFGGYEDGGVSKKLSMYRISPEPDPVAECGIGQYLTKDIYEFPVCVRCPKSFYNLNHNSTCKQCPYGGVCPGADVVLASRGFWMDSEIKHSLPSIYRCPVASLCCQNEEGCDLMSRCVGGTSGPFCFECTEPDHYLWASECVPCKSANGGYVFGMIALALLFILLFLFCEPLLHKFSSNFIFTYQTMSLILERDTFQAVVACLTRLDAEITLVTVSSMFDKCFAPVGSLGKILLSIFFSIFPLFILGLILVVAKFIGSSPLYEKLPSFLKKDRIYMAKKSALITLVLMMPVGKSIISLFVCQTTQVEGVNKTLLTQYPDVECGTGDHVAASVLVSLFVTLPIILFVAYVGRSLYKQRDTLTEEKLTPLSALSIHYQQRYYYWYFVELGERVSIALVTSLFLSDDLDYAWAVFVTLMIMIVLHQSNAYSSFSENWAKLFLLISVLGISGIRLINGVESEGEYREFVSYSSWQQFWIILPILIVIAMVTYKCYVKYRGKGKVGNGILSSDVKKQPDVEVAEPTAENSQV